MNAIGDDIAALREAASPERGSIVIAKWSGRVVVAAAGVLLLAMVSLLSPKPASATFGATGCSVYLGVNSCVYKTKDSDVKYGWVGTVGNQIVGLDTAFDWIGPNIYNATDLTFYRDLTGSLAGADLYVDDNNFGKNYYNGWAECLPGSSKDGSGNSRWCTPQRVRYNSYYKSTAFSTTTQKRFEACHETGHTIGLRHPVSPDTTSTCMKTGDTGVTYLSSAEKSQINANYP